MKAVRGFAQAAPGEGAAYTQRQRLDLLALGRAGIRRLLKMQQQALRVELAGKRQVTMRVIHPTWRYGRAALVIALLPFGACTGGGFGVRPPAENEVVWTIRCAALRGPDRYRRAEECATALKQVSGLKPERVQVFHTDDESTVYYGWYRPKYDPATGEHRYTPNHLPDLDLIRSLSMMVGGRLAFPFIYATMEELPTTRAQHPEWNLVKADGWWSLHVAVFFNDESITNRRYLAEEYCRELRSQGVEAYYHHGPVNSSVCVGAFPQKAVQTLSGTDRWSGAVTATNRIVDERLLELQRKFPHSLQNGQRVSEIVRDPQTGEIRDRVPLASFIVKTPRAEAAEKTPGGA